MFRVPEGPVLFDHTSILKTVEKRWNLPRSPPGMRGAQHRARSAFTEDGLRTYIHSHAEPQND